MSSDELERLTCQELIHKLLYLFETNQEEAVDEALDWFLFTYSPEHAFSLVQKNAEDIKDPTLLDIAMTKIREIYEPEIFLETINVIASIEGHEQEIAKSGAVNSVVIMMGRDIDNARSQALGCKVLANLASDPQVREWIGKEKGITKIINATKRHRNALEVIIECFRSLSNLSYNCKSNKELIIQEHGIEEILDTMELHKSNVKLVNSGLKSLRNIVRNIGNVMELQQHTLTREVMMSMSDHRAISDLQVNGIWILIGLMSGNVELKRYMPEQGAVEHILIAMETHKSDPDVQLAGATALALFSKLASHRQHIVHKRGLTILTSSLQTYRDIVPVQRAVIKALYRLSFNKSIREKLAQHNIVSDIVESMKCNPDNAPLQRMAIISLLQLAKTPELRTIVQQEAVSFMIQARNKFAAIPHVHSVASMAVESMVSDASSIPSPSKSTATSIEMLQNELRILQHKLVERGNVIKSLEETIDQLEEKTGVSKSSMESSDKELEKLKQQKESLSEDLKKAKGETKHVSEELKIIMLQLKEEEKQLKEARKQKQVVLTEIKSKPPKRKQKTKSSVFTDKKPEKEEKEEEKKEEEKEDKENNSKDEDKERIKIKPKRTSTVHPVSKKPRSKSREDIHLRTKDKKEMKSLTRSPRPPSTHPKLPQKNDSNDEPTTHPHRKPPVRSTSRSLKRAHISSTSSSNNEEILELRKNLEELQLVLTAKENELVESGEENQKLDGQVKKLTIDLKGAHILIQTLQKESLTKTQNREQATGSSFSNRYQKKLKTLKDQLSTLSEENEQLKKELHGINRDDKQKDKEKSKQDNHVISTVSSGSKGGLKDSKNNELKSKDEENNTKKKGKKH